MRIHTLHIKHFRNLIDLTAKPNEDINVLVGPNNSGKTNLLRAASFLLDPGIAWYRDEVITIFDFTNTDTAAPIIIEAWLSPTDTDTDETKARLYNKLSHWTTDGSLPAPITRDPTTDNEPPGTELLYISLTASWNDDAQAAETHICIKDETGEDLCPFTLEHKRLIDFRYFPARRDPIQQLSLARRSLLSRNIKEDDLARILRQLRTALEDAKGTLTAEKSVQQLLKDMGELIAPELLNMTEFTLTFLSSEIGRLRSTTSIATAASNHILPLDHQGDGIQNLLLILNIVKLAGGASTIIALEEPEQNLEPAIARWTFSQIAALSGSNANQLFVSTHNPALLQELDGVDAILLATPTAITAAKHLKGDAKKRFERYSATYASTLFARHVLITEGPSELGFLPIAIRHFSATPADNPFHFGLELFNGEDRNTALLHAKALHDLGRSTHVLLDYDEVQSGEATTNDLLKRAAAEGSHATTWSDKSLLHYAKGCDLEILLAAAVEPTILRTAILLAYEDLAHELRQEDWIKAKQEITDENIRSKLPTALNLPELRTGDYTEDEARALNLALLHGPHSCKSTRDMRLIAQELARKNAIPSTFDKLRKHLLDLIKTNDGSRTHVLLG